MPRWARGDREAIAAVRRNCRDLLELCPPYEEVVGDRKILRFLRGHGNDVMQATEKFRKFLAWRDEVGADDIRFSIVEGGMGHPTLFPRGEEIMKLMPQIVLAPDACDKKGNPICFEQYAFSPVAVLKQVPMEHHVTFATYCLEFRSLILEQLSEEKERAYLARLTAEEREREQDEEDDTREPYGILLHTCVIRDIGALSLEHCRQRELLTKVVTIASDNYPELLQKCFLLNTPKVFIGLWYFIRGMLPKTTVAKVALLGSDYHAEVFSDIEPGNVPVAVGGTFSGGFTYSAFQFDLDFLRRRPPDEDEEDEDEYDTGTGTGTGTGGSSSASAGVGETMDDAAFHTCESGPGPSRNSLSSSSRPRSRTSSLRRRDSVAKRYQARLSQERLSHRPPRGCFSSVCGGGGGVAVLGAEAAAATSPMHTRRSTAGAGAGAGAGGDERLSSTKSGRSDQSRDFDGGDVELSPMGRDPIPSPSLSLTLDSSSSSSSSSSTSPAERTSGGGQRVSSLGRSTLSDDGGRESMIYAPVQGCTVA